ncbi:MAG TPA: EF-hand domain-containing protein [Candidatus Competibacteraceae bacterium]|nr:EF-hand domain-containing protein [Candidatus Competibacteraceae bacterium]HQA26514.1 EF-hand domain-containing protein [Candidatus Competibacteraceae bacterium]HQD57242.1 EF-hand domain-containing protein [Candidatus Competibacteraceae bacterium]
MSVSRSWLSLIVATVALASVGSVSAASRQERLEQELQQRFIAADVNHDGLLTTAEANGRMPYVYNHFALIDEDKNGLVSMEDIRVFIVAQMANRPALR